jgi:hypothetical protein
MGLEFTWDEEKNRENQTKHGVSFEEAVYVFNQDTNYEYDQEHSTYEEIRYIATGYIKNHGVIMVVHSEAQFGDSDIIRIISARRIKT